MLFIGICGASGSGKSTLAEALEMRLGARCHVMQQDCYYLDHSHLPFEERKLVNYDAPSAFDHELLLRDVRTLMAGQPVTRKGYDYTQHIRADTEELIVPPEVLILEGIHCFHDERLRDLMFLKVYMKVEPDICLLRRIQRDIKERGRDIDGIAAQYLTTVKPMYDRYVRNYINHADVIVAGGGHNARIVDILCSYVRAERGDTD